MESIQNCRCCRPDTRCVADRRTDRRADGQRDGVNPHPSTSLCAVYNICWHHTWLILWSFHFKPTYDESILSIVIFHVFQHFTFYAVDWRIIMWCWSYASMGNTDGMGEIYISCNILQPRHLIYPYMKTYLFYLNLISVLCEIEVQKQ